MGSIGLDRIRVDRLIDETRLPVAVCHAVADAVRLAGASDTTMCLNRGHLTIHDTTGTVTVAASEDSQTVQVTVDDGEPRIVRVALLESFLVGFLLGGGTVHDTVMGDVAVDVVLRRWAGRCHLPITVPKVGVWRFDMDDATVEVHGGRGFMVTVDDDPRYFTNTTTWWELCHVLDQVAVWTCAADHRRWGH